MSEDVFTCLVESPKGSRNEYEYDRELDAIKLKRFVSTSVVSPTDCGLALETLAANGDPLDVLVCVSEPTFPGCVVPVRAIGMLRLQDKGRSEERVVCVPCDDPAWAQAGDVAQLPAQLRAEIGHFLAVNAGLEPGDASMVLTWADRAAAAATVSDARARFRAASNA